MMLCPEYSKHSHVSEREVLPTRKLDLLKLLVGVLEEKSQSSNIHSIPNKVRKWSDQ